MSYPKINCHLEKLRRNVITLRDRLHENGMTMTAVGKCFAGDGVLTALLEECEPDFIGDSRTENLRSFSGEIPRVLLRPTMPSRADETVRFSEISLESSVETLPALSEAAEDDRRTHRVVLMIDAGDLREGIMYYDTDAVLAFARECCRLPSLELYGVGVNFSCFGGVAADRSNLGEIVKVAELIRGELGVELPMVSGGNSSSISLVGRDMPEGITNLRLGESWLLGNNTADGSRIPGLHYDGFTLDSEIIEVQTKPSKPIGTIGPNAFGETVTFPDRGPMRRAITALGRQDTIPESLTPTDGRISILGASSDHMILDVSGAPDCAVGDIVSFIPGYGALLRGLLCPHVDKEYI